jgi:hypothetical protein
MEWLFQVVSAGSSNKSPRTIIVVMQLRKSKFASILMVALLISTSLSTIIGAHAITVETSNGTYMPGDSVFVNGTAVADSEVYITVVFNETDIIHEDDFTAFEDGNYSTSFELDNDAEPGSYNLSVVSGEEAAFILFTVEAGEPENETVPEPDEPENETIPMPDDLENETLPMPDELENETAPVLLKSDPEGSDGEGLSNAIDRAKDYFEKLRDMIGELSETYGDDPGIIAKLAEIKEILGFPENDEDPWDLLVLAEEAVVSGDNSVAAGYLSDARSLMGRAKGLVTSVFKDHKVSNMEKFGEQVRARIDGLQAKIDDMGEGLANGPEVSSALGGTKLKMNDVMKMLRAGNSSEAMDILEAIVGEIDGSIMSLGNETGAQFKSMYKLEAKIKVLEKQAAKLQRKGLNATEVYDMIASAQGQLSQVTGGLVKGNKGGNGVVGLGGSDNNKGPKDGLKGYMKPKKNGKEGKGNPKNGGST